MAKIKINGEEFEFRFRFKEVGKLLKVTGKNLGDIQEITQDFNNAALIGSIGIGKTCEEVEELLDKDGTFESVSNLLMAFAEEVGQYFQKDEQKVENPNVKA